MMTQETTISFDIEIKCDACGESLNGRWNYQSMCLDVDPCEKCLQKARDDAQDEADVDFNNLQEEYDQLKDIYEELRLKMPWEEI
jgi:hypothetical protein